MQEWEGVDVDFQFSCGALGYAVPLVLFGYADLSGLVMHHVDTQCLINKVLLYYR
jgi:hypothetical protein